MSDITTFQFTKKYFYWFTKLPNTNNNIFIITFPGHVRPDSPINNAFRTSPRWGGPNVAPSLDAIVLIADAPCAFICQDWDSRAVWLIWTSSWRYKRTPPSVPGVLSNQMSSHSEGLESLWAASETKIILDCLFNCFYSELLSATCTCQPFFPSLQVFGKLILLLFITCSSLQITKIYCWV